MHDFIFAVDEPLLQGGNITFVKNIGETSQFSGSPTMVGLGGAFPEHKDLTVISLPSSVLPVCASCLSQEAVRTNSQTCCCSLEIKYYRDKCISVLDCWMIISTWGKPTRARKISLFHLISVLQSWSGLISHMCRIRHKQSEMNTLLIHTFFVFSLNVKCMRWPFTGAHPLQTTHSVQVTVGSSFLAVAETVELEFITWTALNKAAKTAKLPVLMPPG